MQKCTLAWVHAHIPDGYLGWQKRHNGACVLADREEEKGGAGQFPPAGSYLTSSITMPAKRTCNPATHTLSHNFRPIPKAVKAFYPVQRLIQQRYYCLCILHRIIFLNPSSFLSIHLNRLLVLLWTTQFLSNPRTKASSWSIENSPFRVIVTADILPFQKDPCLCGGVYLALIQMGLPHNNNTLRLDAGRNVCVCLSVCFYVGVCEL